jgi:hypothetical protein
MLFENYMFDVLLNANKGGTSKDDPLLLNEEDNQHDPFEFPITDSSKDFSFSRLLSNVSISEQLPSNNGDINNASQ